MTALPPSLTRHGIKVVSDNLPEGAQVQVSGRELARLFGLDVVQAIQSSNKNNKEFNHARPAVQTVQAQIRKPRIQRKTETKGV